MTEDEKRHSYVLTFSGVHGETVLEDLERFANYDRCDFCNDPRKETYMQGRRSVICEIKRILKESKNGLQN